MRLRAASVMFLFSLAWSSCSNPADDVHLSCTDGQALIDGQPATADTCLAASNCTGTADAPVCQDSDENPKFSSIARFHKTYQTCCGSYCIDCGKPQPSAACTTFCSQESAACTVDLATCLQQCEDDRAASRGPACVEAETAWQQCLLAYGFGACLFDPDALADHPCLPAFLGRCPPPVTVADTVE